MSVNQFGGLVRSTPDASHPDTQIYFNPLSYTQTDDGGQQNIQPDSFPGFILCSQPARPKSLGQITLAGNNPSLAPVIQPNSLTHDDDLSDIVRGARLCERLLETPAMSALIKQPEGFHPVAQNDTALIEDFRQRASTVYHPVGTCRMGPDPHTSVVDQTLKVHGIAQLRVVDASVFPNLTSGNTNAPTIMTAHRAAERIVLGD